MSEYPEHDHLEDIKEDSNIIGEFLEWLHTTMYCIGEYVDDDEAPVCESDISTEKLLAKYFGINLDKLELEKKHMLAEIRGLNENKTH
jgi:hypothetical protein